MFEDKENFFTSIAINPSEGNLGAVVGVHP
jgi:hypothetical protein